jgi:hypothetical protein
LTHNDAIPIAGHHRKVGLHAGQSEERLEVVRRDLDRVFDENDLGRLTEIAGNPAVAPEARLFAAAKLQAVYELAAQDREKRPLIDLERVAASVAGLNSRVWRNPAKYCSLLDHQDDGAARRERALPEEILP